MILPYSPISAFRNEPVRMRRVDPGESIMRVQVAPMHDPGDIAGFETRSMDRIEISEEAKRLLDQYERSRGRAQK